MRPMVNPSSLVLGPIPERRLEKQAWLVVPLLLFCCRSIVTGTTWREAARRLPRQPRELVQYMLQYTRLPPPVRILNITPVTLPVCSCILCSLALL